MQIDIMKSIKQLIPQPVKSVMRSAYYICADAIESLQGHRDYLTPPRRMFLAHGGSNYKKIGESFLHYFVEFCDLQPNEKVLDIGSGSGRMAVPLTKYLSSEGSYEGFDIIPEQVKWCQKNITPMHPNFHFQLADIYNKEYNPRGKDKASDYRFPYADETFDFIFLTSVFTHLLPPDMEYYLSEIARVLKKGGRCLVTFFLLNEESLELIKAQKSSQDFKFDFGVYRIKKELTPEAAIAYDEEFITEMYRKYNLEIKPPIHYGSWCERLRSLDYQDIIVASKALD